ncbi:mediator of RNA polymerase II transcription subunit 20-like isoform X2 [Thrips palmi]|uniref:Mediator of RNA polymerase II transcription subunit 20 n=1 Tax=Thrips palmi TaxID=161013 RepID=A0A6P8Z7J5_THRPL|nr:mediator of RNA polymerase II transcription subunit 20-like isoform X2 [Thrips palmi]
MGVTIVQHYPMTENRTGPQVIEFLTKRVHAMGATQSGAFLVDCDTYNSVPAFGELRKHLTFVQGLDFCLCVTV